MGMAAILVKNRGHYSNLPFPQPKEAPYEIWAKLAQGLQRRSRLKMLTEDDGRKVITITHSEHSSGELKKKDRLVSWKKKNCKARTHLPAHRPHKNQMVSLLFQLFSVYTYSCHLFILDRCFYYCVIFWSEKKTKKTLSTLKAPIMTIAEDNLIFFLIFQRKQVLTFHVNRLLGRLFTWKVKTCFLWKMKKI